MIKENFLEDTAAYLNNESKEEILHELYFNSLRTIKSVYLFANFANYEYQLKSDKQEDKQEEYWKASFHEKLIDYVKICIAFETYNKAMLLENGILIHKINGKVPATKDLYKSQNKGNPIRIYDFMKVSSKEYDGYKDKFFLNNLQDNFPTISYSNTLSDKYQEIISLDKELCSRLIGINENRNRLHFFTNFKGAYEVTCHIEKWRFIMDKSIDTIEHKYMAFCK